MIYPIILAIAAIFLVKNKPKKGKKRIQGKAINKNIAPRKKLDRSPLIRTSLLVPNEPLPDEDTRLYNEDDHNLWPE